MQEGGLIGGKHPQNFAPLPPKKIVVNVNASAKNILKS